MQKNKAKFLTGHDFETFCAGFSSTDVGLKLYGIDVPRVDFSEAFVSSVRSAVSRGCTERGLQENRVFFWRIFCEVKQQLPKFLRRKLRLVTTLGTALDFFFGTDFVFLLGKRVVLVDITLDAFNKGKYLSHNGYSRIVFTPFQMDYLVLVSRQIAELLRGDGDCLSDSIFSEVEGLLYNKPLANLNKEINSS